MVHIKGEGVPIQVWRFAAVLLLTVGFAWGCAKDPPQATAGPVDAGRDIPLADLVFGGSDVPAHVLIDSRVDIPPDTQPTPPADVLFPAPPQVICAAASDCDFPPSACAGPSCDGSVCPGSSWVVYYDNPQCIAGKCIFERLYFQCASRLVCSLGGCQFNGTAVAAP